MLRASEWLRRLGSGLLLGALWSAAGAASPPSSACDKPLYLSFDTGHMGVAPLIADVLRRHQVLVTFFAANEATQVGDGSLGSHWVPWWRERAAEGHAFASHTLDHSYWKADLPGGQFRIKPSAGPNKDQTLQWSAAQYCRAIEGAALRLDELSGQKALPLFRAPGGKTSPNLVAAARTCGFAHVGWAPAGWNCSRNWPTSTSRRAGTTRPACCSRGSWRWTWATRTTAGRSAR